MSAEHQYISVRETAQILGVTEKKVMDLINDRKLQAYRIADQFLRLRKNEVLEMRNSGTVVVETIEHLYTQAERVGDFFYYNDFYIASAIIMLALLYIIFYL